MQIYNNNSAPLPIGDNMKIISMAKQGEQLYSFYTEDIISEENQLEIILEPTSDAELTSRIEGL